MWNDPNAAKRVVTVSMNGEFAAREAVAAASAKAARVKIEAEEVAQACEAYEAYLAIYGSLGDAVRSSAADAD